MCVGVRKFFNKFGPFVALIKAIINSVRFINEYLCKLKWRLLRSRNIKRYLDSSQIKKLQIGAGPYILEGWLNTDLKPIYPGAVFLDATKPFPFKECVFRFIFMEHVIELLGYENDLKMLHECYRVCEPGGKIRIATPSINKLCNLYDSENSEIKQRYIKWYIDRYLAIKEKYREAFVINYAFYGFGHKFIFDRVTLQDALEKCGFTDITYYEPGESNEEALKGIEHHLSRIGMADFNRMETMVIEAKRPN